MKQQLKARRSRSKRMCPSRSRRREELGINQLVN